MKLLLTSGGITNKSIADALLQLLGKPFSESNLVFIPTAANPEGGDKSWLIDDLYRIKNLGLNSITIADIALTPSDMWLPKIDEADIMFFGGGNTFYLAEQLERSGLKQRMSELLETKIYAGISAGSMVASREILVTSVQLFDEEELGKYSTAGLSLVPFQFRPHFKSPHFPKLTKAVLDTAAQEISEPMYVLDDQSALVVHDGEVQIVSEGEYLTYNLK